MNLVKDSLKFLSHFNYIDSNNILSDYGIAAVHFNDCNPFIIIELFKLNFFDSLDVPHIISILSIFCDPINNIDSSVISIDITNSHSLSHCGKYGSDGIGARGTSIHR